MKTTKTRPGQKIKLTSVQELLGVSNEETALDLEVEKIRSFKNHPFKVVDDEKMQDLVESIRVNGIPAGYDHGKGSPLSHLSHGIR